MSSGSLVRIFFDGSQGKEMYGFEFLHLDELGVEKIWRIWILNPIYDSWYHARLPVEGLVHQPNHKISYNLSSIKVCWGEGHRAVVGVNKQCLAGDTCQERKPMPDTSWPRDLG